MLVLPTHGTTFAVWQRRGSMHEMPERSHVELVKALLVATNQYDQALEVKGMPWLCGGLSGPTI